MRSRLPLAAVAVAALALCSSASAGLALGLHGSYERFERLTGQQTQVGHIFLGWGQGSTWGSSLRVLLERHGPVPMLALKTGAAGRGGEVVTPLAIARGKGDAYLVAVNRAIGAHQGLVYVRPLPEMNGYWNVYCAFNSDGSARDRAHSTEAYRQAFRRIYLILHGGPLVNDRLAALRLPPVRSELESNSKAEVRVIWNPQGYGSPNVGGNAARAYWPGGAYVDVVGNDLYDKGGKAEWAAAESLYRAYAGKPYSFPEWGLWGIDDPAFVRHMALFARSHPRLELLAYFNGPSGSLFDLATKPRSRAAYRTTIVPLAANRLFLRVDIQDQPGSGR